jgi:cytochrome c-type biogenesis protein CcsB
MARAQAPEHYADMTKIGWEIHLNHFQPFMWAWIAYLIGLLFLVLAEAGGLKWAIPPSWVFLIVGFILHGYGMALRSYIAGRPPVSNMYETVVWVPFGAMLFAFILERVQRNKLLLIGSSMVAIFCLILTDLAPTVLDASLHPLEPVLRSNFWLVTHVLIINISYAAFFLAFALGDVLLFVHLKDEQKYAQFIARGSLSIYRAIQIGVVLIAAGTILGGVWADYSWGRFWGWDPKETWALITLLGYLALLHGRLAGWVKNFELAAGAIVAFSLVIMAWYGVNFALGAGLHTYGFGAGGVEYVTAFVIAHLLYVAYVTTVRYGRLKNARR